MKYQIYKNFLNLEFFEKLKNVILDDDFPWRRREHMTLNNKDELYFTYNFYNNMIPESSWYGPYIIPILKELKALAPIQVRANMTISKLYKASSWHHDYFFKCKTAILYLNDCDGGTELKINNKPRFIKAVANKMLVFDTSIFHRAITSKKEPLRYVLNFNYFSQEEI